MSAIEPMDRITEIVESAATRRAIAEHLYDEIEAQLSVLRARPRTASLQHYLLGVQRALKEEQAAAMHLIADVAALRSQVK
jgi:hypothetical protein